MPQAEQITLLPSGGTSVGSRNISFPHKELGQFTLMNFAILRYPQEPGGKNAAHTAANIYKLRDFY
jgi:hypothetical protein